MKSESIKHNESYKLVCWRGKCALKLPQPNLSLDTTDFISQTYSLLPLNKTHLLQFIHLHLPITKYTVTDLILLTNTVLYLLVKIVKQWKILQTNHQNLDFMGISTAEVSKWLLSSNNVHKKGTSQICFNFTTVPYSQNWSARRGFVGAKD